MASDSEGTVTVVGNESVNGRPVATEPLWQAPAALFKQRVTAEDLQANVQPGGVKRAQRAA
jgi:hypothetical protein